VTQPPLSPDGRFFWDARSQQWLPLAPGMAPQAPPMAAQVAPAAGRLIAPQGEPAPVPAPHTTYRPVGPQSDPTHRHGARKSRAWIYVLVAGVAVVALIAVGIVVITIGAAGKQQDAANETAVAADARNLATAIEVYVTDTLVAPSQMGTQETQGILGPGREVRGYVPNGTDYKFCVVDTASGAWAVYDSANGGLAGRGSSGADCTEG
jgi:type II secretory pathway pseudopilin PulG